jgi:adenosylhomocysteine nucleosidase
MKLAVFAALPQEINPLVRSLNHVEMVRRKPFRIFSAQFSQASILAVLTGIGITNAEAAIKYVLTDHNPDCIISMGFGGALYHNAVIGDLVWASQIHLIPAMNDDTVECPDSQGILIQIKQKTNIHEGVILTLRKWKKKTEIPGIFSERFPFPVSDMETFPLAKYSLQKKLPFFALRAVTDTDDEEIPFNPYEITDKAGNYRITHALALPLRRPLLIPKLIRLGRNSRKASQNLCSAVQSLIATLSAGRKRY